MGLLEKILGVRLSLIQEHEAQLRVIAAELEHIKKRLDKLEEEQKELRKLLIMKADKERINQIERELSEIGTFMKVLSQYILEEKREETELKEISETENLDEVILHLLRLGYDTPSQLVKQLDVGTGKIYEVLERLLAQKKVRKIKRGRKVHYIPVEVTE